MLRLIGGSSAVIILYPLILVQTPKSPPVNNGSYDPIELEVLREHIANRDAKIVELEREAALLRDEKTILESDVRLSPSSAVV